MKRTFVIAAFCVLCGVSALAQNIVWNWVPSLYPGNPAFPDPYGAPIDTGHSLSISMTGSGTADFIIQAVDTSAAPLQVLPEGNNAVLSIVDTPPDIGGNAVLLTSANEVSSLNPDGVWMQNIDGTIGSDLVYGNPELGYGGQFLNQEGFVGLQFYESDGIHYGALEITGMPAPIEGILYGYGYNPVPGQPFDLSLVPVPEPSTWTLMGLGALILAIRKQK